MTVTDPGAGRDLTDVSKQRVEGSRQVILDRDLQLVVNSLWASGAEAIAVGGVRIGPERDHPAGRRQRSWSTTNRSAAPTRSWRSARRTRCRTLSTAARACSGCGCLEASYGVVVTVSAAMTACMLPAGSVRDVNFAKQIGPKSSDRRSDRRSSSGSCSAWCSIPSVPEVVQPYLPIAVVAALDAVFGGLRAYLERIFDSKVFVVSFVFNVLVAALIVFVGDQLGVGTQLSTAIIVVLGIRIFGNAAALRRRLFGA